MRACYRPRSICLLLLGCLAAVAAPPAERRLEPNAELPEVALEVDLGRREWNPETEEAQAREVIAFYGKEVGLVRDAALQARIEAIGHRVITAARLLGPAQIGVGELPDEPMRFTFRVLRTDDINALSVWDGNIYLTEGMVDFCQSDHELAGVIAHEVAHSTLHHLREKVRRMERDTLQQVLAMVAAAFLGINVAEAGMIVQLVHAAFASGYSIEAESEADYIGCFYAFRAGYNPVGMVTTFERLHRLQQRSPRPEILGIAQTHPWSDERADRLEAQIRLLGVPINRRAVLEGLTAGYRARPARDGRPASCDLLLGDEPLTTLVATAGDVTLDERAADSVMQINRALWQGLRSEQLTLAAAGETRVLRAAGIASPGDLLVLHPADAAAAGMSLEAYAETAYRRFLARLRTEELNNGRP